MEATTGRREAHKLATRAALQDSAARLFAERGYEAVTVREIADDARVGERTFYRYFASKEDLLAEQALAWVDALGEAIRARPAAESPYQAVTGALLAAAGQFAARPGGAGTWLLSSQVRPLALLNRAMPRPLRHLEDVIARASGDRLRDVPVAPGQLPDPAGPEFQAQVLARATVAALRTAAIRHRELQARDDSSSPGIEHLLREAFTALSRLTRA